MINKDLSLLVDIVLFLFLRPMISFIGRMMLSLYSLSESSPDYD